jgi:hypothetical protein
MKLFVLVIIILLILIYYNFSTKYENYETESRVKFLNTLDDSDNYVKNLTMSDLVARNVSSTKEYQRIVDESICSFSINEKKRLIRLCHNIDLKLAKLNNKHINFVKLSRIPWYFVKVTSKYEDGFPHTRLTENKVVIVLSNHTMLSFDHSLRKTLLHEKIHVYQKLFPVETQLYINKLGFNKTLVVPAQFNVRANPDLDGYIYQKNNELYYTYYSKAKPKNITDVKTNPKNDIKLEHPFEIMAYTLEKMVN